MKKTAVKPSKQKASKKAAGKKTVSKKANRKKKAKAKTSKKKSSGKKSSKTKVRRRASSQATKKKSPRKSKAVRGKRRTASASRPKARANAHSHLVGNPQSTLLAHGHARFLGTGNAFNTDGRFSQCLMIRAPSGPRFLVDIGPTGLAAIQRFGVDTRQLDAVFFTHLHGDHIAGWPFLMLHFLYIDQRTRPLHVCGPTGIRAHLESLVGLCYGEIFSQSDAAFPIRFHELPVVRQQNIRLLADVEFDTFPMEHHESSIGYVFRLGGKALGVSGDTRWCPQLEALASASEILILECTTVEPSSYAHIALEEIRDRRSELEVGEIVLVHLSDDVASHLAERPIRGVAAAVDGAALPLT